MIVDTHVYCFRAPDARIGALNRPEAAGMVAARRWRERLHEA